MNVLRDALENSIKRIEARIENDEILLAIFKERIAGLHKIHNRELKNLREKTLRGPFENLQRKIRHDKNLLKIFMQRAEKQREQCEHKCTSLCLGDDKSIYCHDCRQIVR